MFLLGDSTDLVLPTSPSNNSCFSHSSFSRDDVYTSIYRAIRPYEAPDPYDTPRAELDSKFITTLSRDHGNVSKTITKKEPPSETGALLVNFSLSHQPTAPNR